MRINSAVDQQYPKRETVSSQEAAKLLAHAFETSMPLAIGPKAKPKIGYRRRAQSNNERYYADCAGGGANWRYAWRKRPRFRVGERLRRAGERLRRAFVHQGPRIIEIVHALLRRLEKVMVYSGPRGESRVQGTVMLNMGRYYVHFDVEAVRVRLDKKPPFDIPNFKKLQFERGTNSKGAYIIISDAGTPHDWKDKWANM